MKRFTQIISVMLLVVIAAAMPVFAAENKDKKSESVMLNIYIVTDINGKSKGIKPRVATMDKRTATITIGDNRATLNKQDVETDKAMKEGTKDFYTKVEMTPEIVQGSSPSRIKLDIKFYLQQGTSVITQNFKVVVIEKEPFTFVSEDPSNKMKTELTITAEIRK
jgi:RNase P/RNase MRP subunit p29